jgi:hypothetical protein
MRWLLFNPRLLTLETGVPAMSTFCAQPDVILDELRRHGITHVVLGAPVADRRETDVRATVASRPSEFTPEFRNPTFTVYRFVPAPRRKARRYRSLPDPPTP